MKPAVDHYASVMTSLEAFDHEFAQQARTPEQIALAKAFSEFVAGEADASLKHLTGLAMGAEARGAGQAVPAPAQRARFQAQDRGNDLGR